MRTTTFATVRLIDSTDVAIPTARSEVENSIAVSPLDPKTLLVANIVLSNGGVGLGIMTHLSQDGGYTWSDSAMISPSRSDPYCVIGRVGGPQGRFFVNHIESAEYEQGVHYKDAVGAGWNYVQIQPKATVGTDKNHLWIDNNPASDFANRLYCGFSDQLTGPSHVYLKYSRGVDNGTAWLPLVGQLPIQIDGGIEHDHDYRGIYLQTGPAPAGRLYATWTGHVGGTSSPATAKAVYARYSSNGGEFWTSPTYGQRIRSLQGFGPYTLPGKSMRTRVFPSMTVDQATGHVYIVYTDRPVGQADTDVFVLKSADQGLTWNALGGTPQSPSYKRINQGLAGKDQWHAAITWDDTTGALVAVYFDSRGFPANDGVDTYLSASYDGGNTWQDLKLSDVGWDGDPPPGVFNDPFAGDYISVVARDGIAYAVWSDDRQVADTLRPFVSPVHLWGPVQESITHNVQIQPEQKIAIDVFWSTNARCKGTDEIVIQSPSGLIYTESCTTCWSNTGLNHSLSTGVYPCEPGWWTYEVKSTRLGYGRRGSFQKRFLVNCID